MVKCPYCRTEIEADSFVCKNCKQIVKLVYELSEKLNTSPISQQATDIEVRINTTDFYFHLVFYLIFLTIPIFILFYSGNVEVFIFAFYLTSSIATFLFTLVVANYTQYKNVIVLSLIGFTAPQLFLFVNMFFDFFSEIPILDTKKVIETLAFSSYVMLFIGFFSGLLVKLMNRKHDLRQLYDYKQPVEWMIKGDDIKEKVVKIFAVLTALATTITSIMYLLKHT